MNDGFGYFYHGTGEDINEGISTMLEIIESGSIQSANKRQADIKTLYNGNDYISVCRWDDLLSENGWFDSLCDSAFYGWIFNCPCFIISDKIPAIKCRQVSVGTSFDSEIERVSQFKDEWQVKDEILLDDVIAIALPFIHLEKNIDGEVTKDTYDKVKKILEYASCYKWQVFNSDNQNLIKEVDKKLIRTF